MDRYYDMALDLLLAKPILGRLVQPRRQSCIWVAKAYPKVLKHRQLGMFQFRTVSGSTDRGSLGKEMGKLLGKPAQAGRVSHRCFPAFLVHLMYMQQGALCDAKPCRSLRTDGVCL